MDCLIRKVARFTPSLKHFGAVAENIANKPITTKNITMIKIDLSGADKISPELLRLYRQRPFHQNFS